MGLNRFPINDFSGGWNVRDDMSVLQSNESPSMENVTIGPVGQLQQRAGVATYSDMGATSVDNIYLFTNGTSLSASQELIVSNNDTLYNLTTGRALFTGGFPGLIWSMAQLKDSGGIETLFAGDGTNLVVQYSPGTGPRTPGGSPPASAYHFRTWKNRLLYLERSTPTNRLYYSNVGDPRSVANTLDFPGGTSLVLTAIETLGENVLIFSRDDVWMIYDPVNFANRRLGGPGCEGILQTAVVNNRCYYFHRSGIYSVGMNGDIRSESDQIRPVFTGEALPGRSSPGPDSLDMTQLSLARVCGTPSGRVLISIPTSPLFLNNVLYELIPNFSVRTSGNRRTQLQSTILRHEFQEFGAPQCMTLVNFSRSSPKVLAGLSGDGPTCRYIVDLDANVLRDFDGTIYSTVVNSFWLSGYRGIQEEEPIERLRRIGALYQGSFRITVQDPTDVANNRFTGSFPNTTVLDYARIRPELRARYHQIMVQGVDFQTPSAPTGWSVSALELVYRGGKEH